MQSDFRNSTVARIGRSYPRLAGSDANGAPRASAGLRRYRVTGALIVVFSALGLLGWFLAR